MKTMIYVFFCALFSIPTVIAQEAKNDKGQDIFTGIESNTFLIKELRKYKDPRKAKKAYLEYMKGRGDIANKERMVADEAKDDVAKASEQIKQRLKGSGELNKLKGQMSGLNKVRDQYCESHTDC